MNRKTLPFAFLLLAASTAAVAQESILSQSTDRSEGSSRAPLVIDRVLRNEPNPDRADPNIVDAFRLADGSVAYFTTDDPGNIQFEPYADFIQENPLYEVPLPSVMPERIASSTFNHNTSVTIDYSLGASSSATVDATDTSGHLFGCDLREVPATGSDPEPIHGLSVTGHQTFLLSAPGRGSDSACRFFPYAADDADLTAAHSVVANLSRDVRIEVTSYEEFGAIQDPVRYPRAYQDHIPYGDVVSFPSHCSGDGRYLKVSVAYDLGVAGVAYDGPNLTADRAEHRQGARQDTYATTHLIRHCGLGGTSGQVTVSLNDYLQSSVAELRTAADYNPMGLPDYGDESYLSGLFHRCGALSTVGTHGAGVTSVTRDGRTACSPDSNTPLPEAELFRARQDDTLVPAIMGTADDDYQVMLGMRHNPRHGVLVSRDGSGRMLFYYGDRFHLWHNVDASVPARPVSYLTRNAIPANGAPTAPIAPSTSLTNCRVEQTGSTFQCQADQGQVGATQPSFAEAEATCYALCGSNLSGDGCNSDAISWGEGSCFATVTSGAHDTIRNLTNESASHNGELEVRCNAGTWVSRQQGSCEPIPCAAANVNWGSDPSCSASLPLSQHGDTRTAVDGSSSTEGTASFTCSAGSWQFNSGACEYVRCDAQRVSWGNGCEAPLPQLGSGTTMNVTSDSEYFDGSATFRCIDRNWSQIGGHTCQANACPPMSVTCGEFTHDVPEQEIGTTLTCRDYASGGGLFGGCDYSEAELRCEADGSFSMGTCDTQNPGGFLSCGGGLPTGCPVPGTVQPPEDGACGSAAGQPSVSQPAPADSCSSGQYVSGASTDSLWNWQCAGVNGGSSTSCTAPRRKPPSNGTCGPAAGVETDAQPSGADACSAGIFSDQTDSSTDFRWRCAGENSGTSTFCSAPKAPEPIDGVCGPADGSPRPGQPTEEDACTAGTYRTRFSIGAVNWSCDGINGGATANCSSPRGPAPVPGQCGTSHAQSSTTQPSGASACAQGTFSDASDSATRFNWQCLGDSGESDASCYAIKAEDGVCGPADGGVYTSTPPTSSRCSNGTVSGFTGNSTNGWSWTCTGSGGGATDSCQTQSNVQTDCSARTYFVASDWYSRENGVAQPPPGEDREECRFDFPAMPFGESEPVATTTPGMKGVYTRICSENGFSGLQRIQACQRQDQDIVDGQCGAADDTTRSSPPPLSERCAHGDVADFRFSDNSGEDNDRWLWRCEGNGRRQSSLHSEDTTALSLDVNCRTQRSYEPVDGVCGPADGQEYSSQPSISDRCSQGAVINFTGNTSQGWNWSCSGNSGGSTDSCATVPAQSTPVINTFTVSPARVTRGQSTTLSYSASGATRCTITGTSGNLSGTSGTVSKTPGAGSTVNQATYTLRCYNGSTNSDPMALQNVTIAIDEPAPQLCTPPWISR